MSQPTELQSGRPEPRRERVRLAGLLGAGLLLANAHCTFPEYDIRPASMAGSGAMTTAGAGATAGGGAVAGAGGNVAGGGSSSGGDPSTGAAAGEAGSGSDPACLPEQWPVEHCSATCLHRYPGHCYDGQRSGDEIALDCGGSCQGCTLEGCSVGADCLSGVCDAAASDGACFAPISLELVPGETSSLVGSTTWSVTLRNEQPAGGRSYPLASLKIRYYLERSGLTEPLVVRATQANLTLTNGESRGLQKKQWLVQRVEHLTDRAYDAYVEVSFTEGGALFPGDRLDLYQQLVTGDPGRSNFDQRTNYSFMGPADARGLHMTVHSGDQLLWGLEPLPANPRSCFVRGVNFNGAAVTIDGNTWESSQTASVTTSGAGVSTAGATYPVTSGGMLSMLNKATRLQVNDELSLPVENGTYLVYLSVISQGSDSEASLLTVQGEAPDSSGAFRSQSVDNSPVWAKLGPYRVDVTDGKLVFGVTKGAVNLAGLELWYPE